MARGKEIQIPVLLWSKDENDTDSAKRSVLQEIRRQAKVKYDDLKNYSDVIPSLMCFMVTFSPSYNGEEGKVGTDQAEFPKAVYPLIRADIEKVFLVDGTITRIWKTRNTFVFEFANQNALYSFRYSYLYTFDRLFPDFHEYQTLEKGEVLEYWKENG